MGRNNFRCIFGNLNCIITFPVFSSASISFPPNILKPEAGRSTKTTEVIKGFQVYKLLHRFHNNLATDEERQALMTMIESGMYDAEIGDEWEKLLKEYLKSDNSVDNRQITAVRTLRERIPLEWNSKHKRTISSKLTTWASIAAAVGILLIMAGIWNREAKPDGIVVQDLSQKTKEDKVYTGKQFVKLPDGSTVLLNERSELRYSSSFGHKIREVYLSGEAFFDIAHNADLPFLVRTGNINTRVLGTAFNVEAWPDQSNIKVTVARGKVAVGDDEHVFEELAPNEQLSINIETEVFKKTKLDVKVATEWKSGFFVLDKVTMEMAALRISKRYDVDVIIENKNLQNCLINGAFLDNESVEHVISVICLAMNANFNFEGDKIRINGGIGCN